MNKILRHDWSIEEIQHLYELPLTELVFRAQQEHRAYHSPTKIHCSALLSIKTGGCPEDCAFCSQSAHYQTGVERTGLMEVGEVVDCAKRAKAAGANRLCMGAAYGETPDGPDFDRILEMIRAVRGLDLEVCCTLGMLTKSHAGRLAEAGLTAYNHNLDTSPEFYKKIVTTRTYQDRLQTLKHVREAGISVCCGAIIGMGESRHDRFRLLQQLSNQEKHPDSVPINLLVRIQGTPLAGQPDVDPLEMVRMIATAKLLMPASMVRLSAGRSSMSVEAQALCFLAGANSIFIGEKLLTTPNSPPSEDEKLLDQLGFK